LAGWFDFWNSSAVDDMNKFLLSRRFLFVAFLLAAVQRLPAPLHELPDAPTPTPVPKTKPAQTPKAKPTPPQVSASPQLTPPLQKAGRFAGTWSGTMNGDGQSYPCTVIVDPTEKKASATGPIFGNEGGAIRISGDTISWTWMLDSWSMTLNADSTAHVVKCCMGTIHNGTVKKIK